MHTCAYQIDQIIAATRHAKKISYDIVSSVEKLPQLLVTLFREALAASRKRAAWRTAERVLRAMGTSMATATATSRSLSGKTKSDSEVQGDADAGGIRNRIAVPEMTDDVINLICLRTVRNVHNQIESFVHSDRWLRPIDARL